ncbi:MAG: hypothetical protein HY023_14225 [Chloroflexi bacterium]|nr:hypothetical protein [Chloroflexota bacterium]MBI3763840.1 hypothetical protein [Chloroflexota bacterium]
MESKGDPSTEATQNEDHWQPDPFREPRAWALAWDVTELLRRKDTSLLSGSHDSGGGGGKGLREEPRPDAA